MTMPSGKKDQKKGTLGEVAYVGQGKKQVFTQDGKGKKKDGKNRGSKSNMGKGYHAVARWGEQTNQNHDLSPWWGGQSTTNNWAKTGGGGEKHITYFD